MNTDLDPAKRFHKYLEDTGPLDLATVPQIHVVGSDSPWMRTVLNLLDAKGHVVTEGDLSSAEIPEGTSAVICNDQFVGDEHPIIQLAGRLGIRVISRVPVIAALAQEHRYRVAVTGTCGKTTTSTILDALLKSNGDDPTAVIAAEHPRRGIGHLGDGSFLVVEAHEDDGTLFAASWDRVVLTSVFTDHAERFGSIDGLHKVFAKGLNLSKERALVNADDPAAMSVARNSGARFVTVGASFTANWGVENVRSRFESRRGAVITRFDVVNRETRTVVAENVIVPLPGIHSARNAAMAMLAAHGFGISFADSIEMLQRFQPPMGRSQYHGIHNRVMVMSDAANLSDSIRASIHGVKGQRVISADYPWRRVIAVFGHGDPRVNSESATRAADFGEALAQADVAFVTDPTGSMKPNSVALSFLCAAHFYGSDKACFVPRSELLGRLAEFLREDDCCMLLGDAVGGFARELTSALDDRLPALGR